MSSPTAAIVVVREPSRDQRLIATGVSSFSQRVFQPVVGKLASLLAKRDTEVFDVAVLMNVDAYSGVMSDVEVRKQVRRVRGPAARKAQRAWDARIRGAEWSVVAEVAGYKTATAACTAVRRWRDSLPVSDDMRERMRDEALSVAMFARGKAIAAVEQERSGAIRDLISVEARIAQLGGLDAPNKVAVYSPTDTEIEEWVAAVSAQISPGFNVVEAKVVGD